MYDLAEARLDGDWHAPAPLRSLVVCTTVRSGSTLLGEALHSAGGLGCPLEYLHRGFRPTFAQRWAAPGTDDYLAALTRRRVDMSTGVLGIKLFWTDLIDMAFEFGARPVGTLFNMPEPNDADMRTLGGVMDRLFPAATFVFLQRADVLRRAVSGFRATQTGQFRRLHDDVRSADLIYDYDAILTLIGQQRAVDVAWEAFFATNGHEPIRVRYEDLLRSYEPTVRRILAGLGHPAAEKPIPPPRLRRQADELSEALCRRFLQDHVLVAR